MESIIDVNTLFGPLPAASVDLTVEELLDLMTAGGVESACTLSTLGLLLDANVGNAATRAACSEYSQLIPVATLNPTTFFGDDAAIQRATQDGFKVVRFFPHVQGWPIDYQPFASVLEILAGTGIPVMVSISSAGQMTTMENIGGGYPTVIFTGVDSAHLPEAISVVRRRPGWMLDSSKLVAIGSVKLVVDSVGPEALLFGTGAPAQSLSAALQVIDHSGITAQQRELVLCGNAQRIIRN